MVTQIYNITSKEEAMQVIGAGADILGIVPPQKTNGNITVPGEISHERVVEIMDATKGLAKRVLLYAGNDPEVYFDGALLYRPEMIHLSGMRVTATKAFAEKIKSLVPGILIEQSVPVGGSAAVEIAIERSEYADILILDSVSEALSVVGAAGQTHDWHIDREIVQKVNIPVIVAGGLSPENVSSAIEMIHPYGVDSLTKTNMVLPDGTICKDIRKVQLFCKIAKAYA